jgi:hypothetical protein
VAGLDNFASGDSVYQFAVGFEEVVRGKILAGRPRDRFENAIADCSPEGGDGKEDDFDITVRVTMAQTEDFLADLGRDGKFLGELATQRIFQVFSVAHFASRKLPLQAVGIGTLPLADEDSAAIYDDAGRNQDRCRVGHNIIVTGKSGRCGLLESGEEGEGRRPRGAMDQWMCLTFFCM